MDEVFYGNLTQRVCLSPATAPLKTWQIKIAVPEGFRFAPGDSVAIYPKAPQKYVLELLDYFRVRPEECFFDERVHKSMTAEQMLSAQKDSVRVTADLVHVVLEHLSSSYEKEQLIDYKNNSIEFYDAKTFLQIFAPHGFPFSLFLKTLRPQIPRLYSIASGPSFSEREIDLIVAQVVIKTRFGDRFGLCSGYLTNEEIGPSTPIKMYVQPSKHFSFSHDEQKKIFIAAGTGIAPFRAFMQEVDRLSEHADAARFWLFFGGRRRAYDFFYEDFWLQQTRRGYLRCSTAFSQDQAHKIYVQHRLYEEREHVWRWLDEGALVYVCGNAKTMAKDVDSMLRHIAQVVGGMTESAAHEYMQKLHKMGRYRKDVY